MMDLYFDETVVRPVAVKGAKLPDWSKYSDQLISLSHDTMRSPIIDEESLRESFRTLDEAATQAVCGIAELITQTTYMNVDFADVNEVLRDCGGSALVGTGSATGNDRAHKAAKSACLSLKRNGGEIQKAQGILINVTGNENMTLDEYDGAVSIFHNMADEDANIICGMVYDQAAGDEIRVTVVIIGVSD